MSFWFTPVGIILPIVLQPLLIAIYRFFIIKKPLPVKKAKLISIIYTVVTSAFIGIISNGDAFFQGMAYLLFWLPNCRTLAGRNQNILSKSAEKYMENAVWRARISAVIYVFFLAVLWLVSVKSTAHLLLRLTIPFAVLLFFLFKYRQIEDDVEAGRKWQEKLDGERFEKDKDGR